MRTSNSVPVQFIGEGPLPEFDFSQEPLPGQPPGTTLDA